MGKFTPAQNIDEAASVVDVFPLQPGDSRYKDCSSVRGAIVKKMKNFLRQRDNLHLLFTGYRGTGKTTELYQLQHSIKQEYEVIYYDAAEELDLTNVGLSDLLLAIAKETFEEMKKANYQLPEKLLDDISEWFFEKILEKSASIQAEIGAKAEVGIPSWFSFILAQVFSNIRASGDIRETMRHKLERNMKELIEKINALLAATRQAVKNNHKKDLLFLMDSLDRLYPGLEKNLFQAGGPFLKQLQGNFIYVVPISLLYDEQSALLPFDEQLILPMIPIHKKGLERQTHSAGIAHLKEIVSKRLVVEKIFAHPEETLNELILLSGGHLRDLMRLIGYACSETDEKITRFHAKIAANRFIEDYKKRVREEDYRHLVRTYQTQDPPNDEITRKLIYNTVILVYHELTGEEWKDVHPAVTRNNKFQHALQQE